MTDEKINKKAEEWANLYYTKDSERVSIITEDVEWCNRRYNFEEGAKWALEQCDLQNKELVDKVKELENENLELSKTKLNLNELVFKQASELTELKEKHKRDVCGFAEYISGLCLSNYKSGGHWYLNGGKIVKTEALLKQYYTQTHENDSL